jgi:hypothetical protein
MMHDFGREKTKDVVIFGAAGVWRQAATVLTVAGFCVGGFALAGRQIELFFVFHTSFGCED